MKYTNREVAENFDRWQEYYDPSATMSEAEFDSLTIDEREAMVEEAFGTDAAQSEQQSDDKYQALGFNKKEVTTMLVIIVIVVPPQPSGYSTKTLGL